MDCGKRDVHYNAQNRDSEQYIAQPYRTPQRPRTCLRQRPPPAPASRPQPGSAGPRGQCQPADAGGIESGDVNVSLSTLDRIAAALGVLFPDLVQAPATDRSRINAVAWVGHHPESRATLLASAPARREVELWAWSLGPGERYVSEPDAAGWREMVLVIEGRLRLELADGERRIEAGDFHAFASDQPYAYVNDGDEVVRFTRNVVS